jgi:hypothetical protein
MTRRRLSKPALQLKCLGPFAFLLVNPRSASRQQDLFSLFRARAYHSVLHNHIRAGPFYLRQPARAQLVANRVVAIFDRLHKVIDAALP